MPKKQQHEEKDVLEWLAAVGYSPEITADGHIRARRECVASVYKQLQLAYEHEQRIRPNSRKNKRR